MSDLVEQYTKGLITWDELCIKSKEPRPVGRPKQDNNRNVAKTLYLKAEAFDWFKVPGNKERFYAFMDNQNLGPRQEMAQMTLQLLQPVMEKLITILQTEELLPAAIVYTATELKAKQEEDQDQWHIDCSNMSITEANALSRERYSNWGIEIPKWRL